MNRDEAISQAIKEARRDNDVKVVWRSSFDNAWSVWDYSGSRPSTPEYEDIRYILPHGEVTKLS